MAMLRVFKSTIPYVNYVFGNGKIAGFIKGVYRTDDEGEIASLDYEVKQHHPHIYIDPAEREVDSELLDPMVVMRMQIREQVLAEIAAQNAITSENPDRNMGTSTIGALMPANTRDVQAATVGGASLVSRLNALKSDAPTVVVSAPDSGAKATVTVEG